MKKTAHLFFSLLLSVVCFFTFCKNSKNLRAQNADVKPYVSISASDSTIPFKIIGNTTLQIINGKLNVAVFGEGNMLFQLVEIPYKKDLVAETYNGEQFSAILMKPKEPSCFTRNNLENNSLVVEKIPSNKFRFTLKALLNCGEFPFQLSAVLEGEIPEELFLEKHSTD
jgi:hypothetical protein